MQTQIMKKTGRKSRWTVPSKRIQKSHMTQPSMILRVSSEKYEYLGENETKNSNIFTNWSVAQAGSNDKKTGGRKSRWTVPLSNLGHG